MATQTASHPVPCSCLLSNLTEGSLLCGSIGYPSVAWPDNSLVLRVDRVGGQQGKPSSLYLYVLIGHLDHGCSFCVGPGFCWLAWGRCQQWGSFQKNLSQGHDLYGPDSWIYLSWPVGNVYVSKEELRTKFLCKVLIKLILLAKHAHENGELLCSLLSWVSAQQIYHNKTYWPPTPPPGPRSVMWLSSDWLHRPTSQRWWFQLHCYNDRPLFLRYSEHTNHNQPHSRRPGRTLLWQVVLQKWSWVGSISMPRNHQSRQFYLIATSVPHSTVN